MDNQTHALLEILFREYYKPIYKIVYHYTNDEYVSDEAVQQAFMIAIHKMGTLADKEKFSSWLTVIAINEAKRFYRKQKQSHIVPFEELAIADTCANDDFLDVEFKIDMDSIFNKLKPLDAQIIALKYFMDLSLEEIAFIMNMSLANVKVRLYRARNRFREKYDDSYHELQGGSNHGSI